MSVPPSSGGPERAAWGAGALYAALRLAFPPAAHNTHTLMYPIVEAAGASNTLEPFHPLYVPVLSALKLSHRALHAPWPLLWTYQGLSLLAAAVHVALLYGVVRRAGGGKAPAWAAALVGACAVNLWAWSLQTTGYTLATALALLCLWLALGVARYSARQAALAGLCAGLSAGFDSAAGLILLPVVWDVSRRGGRRAAAACAGAFTLVLASAYAGLAWKFHGIGRELPGSLSSFLATLPEDIIPLWHRHGLSAQLARWRESTAPVDLPFGASAALFGLVIWRTKGEKDERRLLLTAAGATFFAAVSSFFFICDPHNRFIYAGALLLPVVFALEVWRRPRPWLWTGALCGVMLLGAYRSPPDYLPASNPAMDEARFVAGRLGREDLLLAVSEPDWSFAFALDRSVPVLSLRWPGDSAERFGHERRELGPSSDERVRQTLCAKGRVLFAADAVFRTAAVPPERMRLHAEQAAQRLQDVFVVGGAVVSPRGQHYFPLSLRGSSACEGALGVSR